MNPALPFLEPTRWSRRRWAQSILSLFVLQVGLILWLGKEHPRPVERPIFRTTIRLAVHDSDSLRLAELVHHQDPLLLARPNLDGFSGPAWLQAPRIDYRPVEPAQSPAWLALPESRLASGFSSFLLSNRAAPALVMDKPLARLPRYEPSLPLEPITMRSELRVEGELGRRRLLTAAILPDWEHDDLLSNSVVQAAVDADGIPSFAVLLGRSGRREADAFALKFVENARFSPLPPAPAAAATTRPGVPAPPEGLTLGRLVFRWRTLPLTLAAPAPPAP